MNWYSDETQISWACRELIKGREISHRCEIAEAKGWRLSAIIHNLRHRYKWPIVTRYDGNRIGYYRLLSKGGDIDSLLKPPSFEKKEKGAGTPSSREALKNTLGSESSDK